MSGLTDWPPAGGPPVLVQVVLKGVDLISLLDMVGQRIVVMHYPLTEEHPSFLILVISWSDSMVLCGMSSSCGTKPVRLQVKPSPPPS